ncbi:hypothetical protein TNCV_1010951 [Trichonephila clavipes]|uniref:Uncharacterized protein n=1 Tax=Trichonephila clavipes TaxID=2585209 RepID=A0A8X6VX57_TRICX|nr:hypothetical protein TNCV_1010951 [Trichonephila clavipes]
MKKLEKRKFKEHTHDGPASFDSRSGCCGSLLQRIRNILLISNHIPTSNTGRTALFCHGHLSCLGLGYHHTSSFNPKAAVGQVNSIFGPLATLIVLVAVASNSLRHKPVTASGRGGSLLSRGHVTGLRIHRSWVLPSSLVTLDESRKTQNLLICRGAFYPQEEQTKSSDSLDAAPPVNSNKPQARQNKYSFVRYPPIHWGSTVVVPT